MHENGPRRDHPPRRDLLRREHLALAEFLVALAAFDAERRWSELGYSGLFSFLTRELRLSNGAAQNRKTAAELIRRFPQIEIALRSGDLCLSSVNEVAKVITPENAADLLPRFYGKSARDAAFLAAWIRPVENPPERFLVTPVRGSAAPARESCPSRGLELQTCEVRPNAGVTDTPELQTCEVAPAPFAAETPPAVPPARPTIKPLDGERARMNITVSRRLLEKLAAARDALSHSHPGASEDAILELGLDLIIERHRKRRGIGAKPRERRSASTTAAPTCAGAPAGSAPAPSVSPPPSSPEAAASGDARLPTAAATPPAPVELGVALELPLSLRPPPRAQTSAPTAKMTIDVHGPRSGRSRHVPAAVWRVVWERDRGCCAWPLESGGVCGSTYQLELDHVSGWALGAETTVDGTRLLCRRHQDVSARRLYGDDLMDAYTRPKGGRCAEPVAAYAAPCGWIVEAAGRGETRRRFRSAGERRRSGGGIRTPRRRAPAEATPRAGNGPAEAVRGVPARLEPRSGVPPCRGASTAEAAATPPFSGDRPSAGVGGPANLVPRRVARPPARGATLGVPAARAPIHGG